MSTAHCRAAFQLNAQIASHHACQHVQLAATFPAFRQFHHTQTHLTACLATADSDFSAASTDFADEAVASSAALTASALPDPPEDDADSRNFALDLARVCWETKGEDVLALHVAPLVYWTRYMVIATVFSRPQLNAMLARAEKTALEAHDRRAAAPASGRSAWELLDFGDVILHVMTADQREYYDLENFYGAAEELDLPFVVEGANQAPDWQTKL
jgi:ribosome-associated protein